MVSKNLWKQSHVLEYSNKETPVSESNKKIFEESCISSGQRWSAVRGKGDPICGVLLDFSWICWMQYYFLQTFTENH